MNIRLYYIIRSVSIVLENQSHLTSCIPYADNFDIVPVLQRNAIFYNNNKLVGCNQTFSYHSKIFPNDKLPIVCIQQVHIW